MKRTLPLICIILLYSYLGWSQVSIRSNTTDASTQARVEIEKIVTKYDLVEIDIQQLIQSLSSPRETRLLWEMGSNKDFDMRVYPRKIISDSFEAETIKENGERETVTDVDFLTYKGYLDTNETILLTIANNFLYGGIHTKDGTIMIEQLKYFVEDKSIPSNKFIIYSNADLVNKGLDCGNTEKDFIQKTQQQPLFAAQNVPSAGCDVLEVVLDCDDTYWNLHGGNSIARMVGEINLIQEVYENELDILLNVTGAFTFSNIYQSSNGGTILNEIRSRWAPGNISHIARDVVHHFTRKNTGDLGRAFVGSVCNTSNMAVCYSIDRADMHQTVAHEIGHTLDGRHADGANCGVPFARTIMCQGLDKALTFNGNAETRIGNFVNGVNCMNVSTLNIQPVGGNDDLCINDRLWLELDDLTATAGTTITWSLSNGRAIIDSPQNRDNIWVRGVSNGPVTLTATVDFPGTCGSLIVTRSLQVGSGFLTVSVTPNYTGWITATASGGASPYTWTINGSSTFTTSSPTINHFIGCGGGYIQVVANGTPCGGTTSGSAFVPGCSGGGFYLSVSPNPASNELNVTRIQGTQRLSTTLVPQLDDLLLVLYDFSGQIVRTTNWKDGDVATLDVSSLKSGNYFLRITGNGIDETHQVILN